MPVPATINRVARMPLTIHECTDGSRWDAFVEEAPDATGYHLWGWKGVMERAFGHKSAYLMAEREGSVSGVLPLVCFLSPIFGRFLVSLPFVNYGGVVATDPAVADALVARAASMARKMRAAHIELRHRSRRHDALTPKEHKVTMLLPLPPTVAAFWEGLDRKVRNQIRKAEKAGLVAEAAGVERLDEFYAVYSRNMRDLGTPVYGRNFFEEIFRTFPDRAQLVIVRHESRAVAAGVTWRWRDALEVPWASSLRQYNTMSPNNLLYWKIIQSAIESESQVLDFGRSTPNEGTFHFKRQWGAAPLPLCWEYDLFGRAMPDQSPKNPKFKLAIAAWQRLPLPIANWLGPRVVRSIP